MSRCTGIVVLAIHNAPKYCGILLLDVRGTRSLHLATENAYFQAGWYYLDYAY